jgi:predicted ATPase
VDRVRVRCFKQFDECVFDLSDHVILAGPNNSGKTTLLQAIAVWHLGLQKWLAERGPSSKAKKRAGIPVTRSDFTALPLREMNLLWTDTSVSLKKDDAEFGKPGFPRVMSITLEGRVDDSDWEFTFEFRHQSREQIYVKPSEKNIDEVPEFVRDLSVVHVPPFSGIGAEETHYDRPFQNRLIGQGKAGDILRNLLLEIYQQEDKTKWKALSEEIDQIFGYRLLPPEYEGKVFILCDYLPGLPKGKGKNGLPRLDVASAGSGFHQVLLLLGFFYARPASILLLDEPDAHLHVILQKQIYDRLRRIAEENSCQLVIATHAEVLIDSTAPDLILSFYDKPHRLVADVERDQVREALKRLTSTDILLAERTRGVLYVEGGTDFSLLDAWAQVLDHPLRKWFAETPFWHSNQGRNPQEARGHLFALRAIRPKMKGYLLLDGDNRGLPDREVAADGMVVGRWRRYEAESYLLHPAALCRFIERRGASLVAHQYLEDQLPPAVLRTPLEDHDYLVNTPASKVILPELFKAAGVSISKQEYYLVARQMQPEEIAPEVRDKLDMILETLS